MGYKFSIRKHGRKVLTKDNQRRRINILSHININQSKKLRSSNIGSIKISAINSFPTLEDVSSSNTLYSFRNIIDPESIFCINDDISVLDDINEAKFYLSTFIRNNLQCIL